MKKLIIVVLLGIGMNSYGQLNRRLVVIDKETNETVISAKIFSFFQNNCFSFSNIDGILEVKTKELLDTVFQIQSIGYKHKRINKFELTNLDTIKLEPLNTSITLGSNSMLEIEYENFHRKCSNLNIVGYINKYIKGRWISNWGSFIGGDPSGEKMMVGTILNIYGDTLLVENYLFNSYIIYELFKIEIRNDTIFGNIINQIDFNSWQGKIEDCCCKNRNELKIPLCMIRSDCYEYFKYPSKQQGFRRSIHKTKKWNEIKNLLRNRKPINNRTKKNMDVNNR